MVFFLVMICHCSLPLAAAPIDHHRQTTQPIHTVVVPAMSYYYPHKDGGGERISFKLVHPTRRGDVKSSASTLESGLRLRVVRPEHPWRKWLPTLVTLRSGERSNVVRPMHVSRKNHLISVTLDSGDRSSDLSPEHPDRNMPSITVNLDRGLKSSSVRPVHPCKKGQGKHFLTTDKCTGKRVVKRMKIVETAEYPCLTPILGTSSWVFLSTSDSRLTFLSTTNF